MDRLTLRILINATVDTVYHHLTDTEALKRWFVEEADIALDQDRYDFWGRFTPGNPGRQAGKHPLVTADPLHYRWQIDSAETAVRIQLQPIDGKTLLVLEHDGADQGLHSAQYTLEDFWFLSLENLRRSIDGKPAEARVDFSQPMIGDIEHSLEVDATPQTIFEVLLKPEQLERWIASKATVEPKIGGAYTVGWGENVGPIKIVELVENERLSIQWAEAPGKDTFVTWTLAESGGKTRLTLVHGGFGPEDPTGGIHAGWLNFLNWVRSIAEYGADWQPPIKKLTPETAAYYPRSIGETQKKMAL